MITHNVEKLNCSNENTSYIQTQPSMTLQKPFLKWVGGKSQIIKQVLGTIPKRMNNYHEFFLGGGSVLFAVLSLQKSGDLIIEGKIHAYDYNKALIALYNNVKNHRETLYDTIHKYKTVFNSLQGSEINRKPQSLEEAKTSKESYYYWIRKSYNELEDKTSVQASALFMLLNKLCFRGLYREGPNGFNVPYGHYKNPNIITKESLYEMSDLIRNVIFKQSHFEDSFQSLEKSDYVYCDPPYVPENKNSFVGYNSDGFTEKEHRSLFEKLIELKKKGIRFSLSNSKVPMVEEYFQKNYQCEEVVARRAINSKNPEAKTMEVIYYS